MHISYSAHNSKSSISSSSLFEYLDKENQINNNVDDLKLRENFFNSDFDPTKEEIKINVSSIINDIDNNRGSQKLSSSNFYMINVSPSFHELSHLEKIADEELNNRGIYNRGSQKNILYYSEQKDQLMKIQLKVYTQNVMKEYANNLNREIYLDESKLPNDAENKILKKESEKVFIDFLKQKNINLNIKNESEPNESKEWINARNIKEIQNNGKSILVEIDLKERGKAEVYIPKSALHMQHDNSYKLPKNLYEKKINEVIAKNTILNIDYDYVGVSNITINKKEESILHFQTFDKRFIEPLSFSINKNDVVFKDDKYLITAHLLNTKKEYAINTAIEKEFGGEKKIIYNDIAKQKGFDLTKRPLEEKDLLWFAKIEKNRSYKHTDKSVQFNKDIQQKIKELLPNKHLNFIKINNLEKQLLKDKQTHEVIKEGNSKGGNQYHSHIVVSRHDKTMKEPRNKISLSPLANAIDSVMINGAKVGFDRKAFAENCEKTFDKTFEHERTKEQTFEYFNAKSKTVSEVKNHTKQFLSKHTGISTIKNEFNPSQTIKKELGISQSPISVSPVGYIKSRLTNAKLKTSLVNVPKSPTDIVLKVVKKIISPSDGMGY